MLKLKISKSESQSRKFRGDIFRKMTLYAQTLIVVVLIVVKFFGFLIITRDHGSFEGRH